MVCDHDHDAYFTYNGKTTVGGCAAGVTFYMKGHCPKFELRKDIYEKYGSGFLFFE